MKSEQWVIKTAEFSFLPVLAHFATRTCPYCYSIGIWRTFLPLLGLWIVLSPIFYFIGTRLKSSVNSAAYIVTWGFLGCALGFINMTVYSFEFESVFGAFRAALVGGTLLTLFNNTFRLRRSFEKAAAGQIVSISEVSDSKSLIRSGIHSVIVVYTMFTILLFFALRYYLDSSLNVPQALRLRAVPVFLSDMLIVFIFHTFFALFIAFDTRRTLSVAMNSNLDVLSAIVRGQLEKRAPPFGKNEMGQLADAVNQVSAELFEKERIRSMFGKYMNPVIASKILSSSEGKLEGETKEVALLFMDIQGFTSLSEKSTPAKTVEWLNTHFNCVVNVIHAHNGIIDKFIGDAVLAYFDSESSSTAVNAALCAAQELVRNSERLLPFGIGLHYGTVVAGNIGSSERLEYTIIGDAVNSVTRIEGLTRATNVHALASQEFVRQFGTEEAPRCLSELGEFTVKGRAKPIQLWALAAVS
jgi:class 3 adenylate cyclase